MPYQPVPDPLPPMADAERRHASARLSEEMRRRRSVCAFAPDPVPMDVIESAVAAPASGPSGANHQRPFVLIPVGLPAPDATVPDITRRPLDDVLVRR